MVNWGNGSGVPDEDTNVVIVGTDGSGHLHIRIFPDDDKGKTRLIDTDETQLPASQAAAIASLRGKLPPLLPPHKLTDDEKAMVVREATAILGLSHWPGRGLVSAWKTLSQQALFSGHLDVTTWGAAHEAAWAEELLAAFKRFVKKDDTLPRVDGWQSVQSIAASKFQLPDIMPGSKFALESTGSNANQPAFNELIHAQLPFNIPPGNALRTAFGARIADGDRARLTLVKGGYPREWAVEVRSSDNVVLKRRFRATRKSQNATRIDIVETPILDRTLLAVGAAAMDVTGLPPYRPFDPGNVPLVAFQAETPAPGPQAAVVAAFTGGAATLSGAVRDTFVQAVDATLPLTEVGLGATPAIVRVESDTSGPVRWLVPGTNPNLEFYTVRLVAAGRVEVDRPGMSRRYGGATLRPNHPDPAVAQLRKDLRTLGFLGVPEPLGRGGQRLRPARAGRGAGVPDLRPPRLRRARAGRRHRGLGQAAGEAEVPEPLRYQGRLTDEVDNQTRVLIDHWIAEPNRWRCPVVVDARTTTDEGSPAATPDTAFVSGKDNVWGPDEAQGTGVFLFVTDFSALPPIVIPAPPPPVISRRLGFYRNGPVVRNEGPFTPATIAINLDTLTAGLWDTDEAKSTSRVIAAVALRLPCQGFLDGIDAVTVARVVGLGTLYLKDDTSGEAVLGGLGVYLSVARFVEPAAYGLAFGRDGIQSSRPWDNAPAVGYVLNAAKVGQILNDDKAGRLLAGVDYLDREKDKTTSVVSDDADEWRGWHSVYRLASAARVPGAGRAYYDVMRLAILTLGAVRVAMPPPSGPPPTPPPKTRPLNDVFTSSAPGPCCSSGTRRSRARWSSPPARAARPRRPSRRRSPA